MYFLIYIHFFFFLILACVEIGNIAFLGGEAIESV